MHSSTLLYFSLGMTSIPMNIPFIHLTLTRRQRDTMGSFLSYLTLSTRKVTAPSLHPKQLQPNPSHSLIHHYCTACRTKWSLAQNPNKRNRIILEDQIGTFHHHSQSHFQTLLIIFQFFVVSGWDLEIF